MLKKAGLGSAHLQRNKEKNYSQLTSATLQVRENRSAVFINTNRFNFSNDFLTTIKNQGPGEAVRSRVRGWGRMHTSREGQIQKERRSRLSRIKELNRKYNLKSREEIVVILWRDKSPCVSFVSTHNSFFLAPSFSRNL